MPDTPLDPVDEDALYLVLPDQFVGARDRLVKQLRAEKRKEDAARVARRRRPPITAWALNQVARESPALIEGLHRAGERLRAAMQEALGGDASGLRDGRAAERAAVDEVVAAAARRLDAAGQPATDVLRQRMAATVRAAVVDPSVAEPLGRGVLDADHDAPGFGMEGLIAVPPEAPAPAAEAAAEAAEPPATEDDEAANRRARVADLTTRLRAAQSDSDQLANEASELQAEATRLAREAERLSAEARTVMDRADEAARRAAARRAEAEALRERIEAVGGPETG